MVEGQRVAGKYVLGKRLGKGSFGEIFLTTEIEGQNILAVKTEPISSPHPSLQNEAKVLQDLKTLPGIPRVHWFTSEGSHHFLVIDLLGPSIDDLFSSSDRRFSLKTILMIGEQLLTRLEGVHGRGYLHKDLKPANCLVGLKENTSLLYLIDFGLSKKYLDVKSKTHIVYKEGRSMVGTARYASLNTHLGIEPSRRDDLESLFYILIYLLSGTLPWQGIRKCSDYDKYHQIAERKMNISTEVLCKDAPKEFPQILAYIRKLKFEEKPDYVYLKRILRKTAQSQAIEFDSRFDWTAKRERRSSSVVASSKHHHRRRQTKCGTGEVSSVSPNTACGMTQSQCQLDSERTLSHPRCWPGLSFKTRRAIEQLQGPRDPPETPGVRSCCLY